jgi:hypothetical protein
MKNSTKWIIGIVIGLVVLFILPFVWHLVFPAYGYGGMMGNYGFSLHMPMMMGGGSGRGGFGMFPFGMFLMWLIPLGFLVLIGLGIAWLVKQLTAKPAQ